METYELFSLPSDHWTWIATRELPWPLQGFGFAACCGRCGQLKSSLRATYALAWDDALAHHDEQARSGLLSRPPDPSTPARG